MATHAHGSKKTGYTLQQILDMDEYTLTHLDEQKQAAIAKQLGMAANKRIKAMERARENSPAQRGVMESGGKFTFKNKSYADLQNDTSRALQFLKHKTSTVKGWQQVKDETISNLGIALTKGQWEDFWKTYDILVELDPDAKMENIKYDIFKEIHAEMDGERSPEEIATSIKSRLSEIYERNTQLEEQRKTGGVSQYFT